MNDLAHASIELIVASQAPSGAYPAAISYPTYAYCWYRDGSYIAYAADLAGRYDSAARFHDWVARSINSRSELVARALDRAQAGQPLDPADGLHTRYGLEGDDGDASWPNFQLDGLGTWLWGLAEHVRVTGDPLPDDWAAAAALVARYLAALWSTPCYDCWEEFPDEVHTHTLAAIHGGLRAHQDLVGADHADVIAAIVDRVTTRGVHDGHFTKYLGSTDVDASLIGLATPYRLVDLHDPRMTATIDKIEATLNRGTGGVHRYATDTFYGGGEWVVLAGWLGWYHAAAGNHPEARKLASWIEAQADSAGHLPEQVPVTLNSPDHYDEWFQRWGPIASPLLWSHAMYLILDRELDR